MEADGGRVWKRYIQLGRGTEMVWRVEWMGKVYAEWWCGRDVCGHTHAPGVWWRGNREQIDRLLEKQCTVMTQGIHSLV